MKGHKHSEETRKKMSISRLGKKKKPMSVGGRMNIRNSRIGKHYKNLSDALKGRPAWNKGKNVEKLSGSNHWNWKGGVTPVNDTIRKSIEYKLWRAAIFERDKYTCIWCGSRTSIEADHIKRFADFLELRFAIDNGRTLCKKCHLTTDTYGNKTPQNA